MGFLDRLLGREDDSADRQPARAQAPQRTDDDIAIERYRYLLRTAPRAVFLGRVDARGRAYTPDGTQHPRFGDYLLSLGLFVAGSTAGAAVALAVAGA